MQVEIGYKTLGRRRDDPQEGGRWLFIMDKSAFSLLLNDYYGFRGPHTSTNGDPEAHRYTMLQGGSLLLSVALQKHAREHEVLQRIIQLFETDTRNRISWEMHAILEDESHIDALFSGELETTFTLGPELVLALEESNYNLDFKEEEIDQLMASLN